MPASASIDADEIARFSDCDQDWWNPNGAWKPLHKLNPARINYILEIARARVKGLSVLDVGCGGGLLAEPLARMGANVTGLDASPKTIRAARAHAKQEKLKIDYRTGSVEDFARSNKSRYDIVLAMEILEHAADIGSLLRAAASALKPNGVLIVSTVNRTTKSYLLGIVMAEYVLGWVPKGMHDWERFIKPSELAALFEKAGLKLSDLKGMVFNPFSNSFSLRSDNVDVNYLAAAVKTKTF